MKNKLQLYSIVSYNQPEHIDEICEDIRNQYENGVMTCALFSMTLVPVGDPVTDKVGVFCKKYKLFKDKLDEMKVPNGVLVQASMGHGRKLAKCAPFQKIIGLRENYQPDAYCPLDEGFREHMKGVLAHIASLKPDSIMIDDDTRLVAARKGRGCACPLHMARFNALANTSMTKEELLEALAKKDDEAKRLNDIFVEVQRESMVALAKAMREGIDSIDPKIPGTLSVVGGHEAGAEMAKVLAGEGNPSVLRIGSGNYTPAGARNQSRVALRTARQISYYKGKVDYILAETDTCPQNRYSTGAHSLHTHFTDSILVGANGAKHWITRLHTYEPESGKAYRKILEKNCGFYTALANIVPTLSWRGFRIPVPDENIISVMVDTNYTLPNEGWSSCVLERLGLPMYFESNPGGITCLNGDGDSEISDEKIMEILSGNVFLASDTAENLIRRGFGKYLGVNVRPWEGGKAPTTELLLVNGNRSGVQMQRKEIVPESDSVRVDSKILHSLDGENFEYLFPGTTVYKNELGGSVVVFCGTPMAEFNYLQAFSFLNYSRKQQIIKLAKEMSELPVYYPGDQELYLRAADMEDGTLFVAAINISLDPMEEMNLVFEKEVSKIEKLMPDGSRKEVSFRKEGEEYVIDTPCNILDPVILFVH